MKEDKKEKEFKEKLKVVAKGIIEMSNNEKNKNHVKQESVNKEHEN